MLRNFVRHLRWVKHRASCTRGAQNGRAWIGLALAGAAPEQEDLDPAALIALETDRLTRAHAARATFGISPAALALAFGDWALHLAASPGKLVELQRKAARKLLRYGTWWSQAVQGKPCANCIEPLEQDTASGRVAQWPFNAIYHLFRQWWWRPPRTHGVPARHAHVVTVRQLLDIVSPSNFPG
jgi:polyhydroxyalkanoate synthase